MYPVEVLLPLNRALSAWALLLSDMKTAAQLLRIYGVIANKEESPFSNNASMKSPGLSSLFSCTTRNWWFDIMSSLQCSDPVCIVIPVGPCAVCFRSCRRTAIHRRCWQSTGPGRKSCFAARVLKWSWQQRKKGSRRCCLKGNDRLCFCSSHRNA